MIIVQYYCTGNNLGYVFEKEQIKILAEIHAEIDIDREVMKFNNELKRKY